MPDHDVLLEIYHSGAWHTAPAMAGDPVQITYGRGPESSERVPTQATLTVDNSSGDWDPSDQGAAVYGVASRYAPARLSIDDDVRLTGEVVSWAPTDSVDRVKRTVPITIADPWHRQQSADPLFSAARRGITSTAPRAYWPLEDSPGATGADSAVPGVAPMTPGTGFGVGATGVPPANVPTWSAGAGPAGSDPLVSLINGGRLRGLVPDTASTMWEAHWVMTLTPDQVLAAGASGDEPLLFWAQRGGDGTLLWQVEPSGLTGIDQDLRINFSGSAPAYAGTGMSLNAGATMYDGIPHHYAITAAQNGSSIELALYIDGALVDGDTDTGTLLPLTDVYVGPYAYSGQQMPSAIGHVAVWDAVLSVDAFAAVVAAVRGHVGELAGTRLARVCAEEGLAFAAATGTDLADTPAMGPQPTATLADVLAECERLDDGVLHTGAGTSLYYRSRASLYNQAPALTLDYAAGQIGPPLTPALDDVGIANDVTVSTPLGATARASLSTGMLSTAAPPDGIGRVPATVSINSAESPVGLSGYAQWHLHRRTPDGGRWSDIVIDMDAAPDLAAAAVALTPGDVVRLTGVRPDPIDVMVHQIIDRVFGGGARRTITLVCAQASPWAVGEVDHDDYAILGSDGSTVAAEFVAGTDTELSVAVAAGYPLWASPVAPEDAMPYEVTAAGARLTVRTAGEVISSNAWLTTDADGWVATAGCTIARSTAQAHEGTGSLLITPDEVTATVGATQHADAQSTTTAAATYLLAGWIYSVDGLGDARMAVDWYRADGSTYISSGLPAAADVEPGVWTHYAAVVTAPALGERARLRVRLGDTPTGPVYVDGLLLIPTVSYTASPQTLTVAQSTANGVTKTVPVGAPVDVHPTTVIGL